MQPPAPHRTRLVRPRQALLAAAVFAGGLLASGMFSSAVPAAPEECLPVVGCVTTPLPPVTLPTLPTTPVPVPTLPVTTSQPDPGPAPAPASTTTSAGGTKSPESAPEAALTARSSVRVRGRGANRVIEIRLRLSKAARVNALLSRNGRALARRQFAGRAGASTLRVRVGRTTRSGPARLALTFRSDSGESARATYRLRLPR
jgi:hypothetical protein